MPNWLTGMHLFLEAPASKQTSHGCARSDGAAGPTEQVAGQQGAAAVNPLHSQSLLDIQQQKSLIFTKACATFFSPIFISTKIAVLINSVLLGSTKQRCERFSSAHETRFCGPSVSQPHLSVSLTNEATHLTMARPLKRHFPRRGSRRLQGSKPTDEEYLGALKERRNAAAEASDHSRNRKNKYLFSIENVQREKRSSEERALASSSQ